MSTSAAERTATDQSTGNAERVTGEGATVNESAAADQRAGNAERVTGEGATVNESATADQRTTAGQQEVGDQPLFGAADVERLRTAWRQLQGSFVDSPHDAVTQADDLVMATVQQLSATLAERKQSLERLWSREEDGDTEDLRLALRSYRAFFDQLVDTGK
ncbi:hypothetical protein ACQPXH_06970 [Nocardia sp. CA-135953]|uniref:hypothetical protein n=1 Tax=Nocardia sp. CA-135953 TaxID=3239978 RepID=UPI003D96289F